MFPMPGPAQRLLLQERAGAATRAALSFVAPLALVVTGHLQPLQGIVACFSAHSLTMLDAKGSYGHRLRLLALQALIMALAVGLGGLATHHLAAALAGAVFMAMATGFLRHLSPEYGAGMATPAVLLYFTALSGFHPLPARTLGLLMGTSLLGSLWGIALLVAAWPISPQHPLRAGVSETWKALGAFASALAKGTGLPSDTRHQELVGRELALDQAAAHAQGVLDPHPGMTWFTLLNREAGALATLMASLDQLLGTLPRDAHREEAFRNLALGLCLTSEVVAEALVTRRGAPTRRVAVEAAGLQQAMGVLRTRMAASGADPERRAHARELLDALDRALSELPRTLLQANGQADAPPMPLRSLEELEAPAPSPFGRLFNLDAMGHDLLRYSRRLAVAMLLGTAVYQILRIPHGFWIPFSTLVVLQPDYGSTLARAFHRTLGTLLGGLAASLLLWIHLPQVGLLVLSALLVAAFTHYVKRHYGFGIFLLTVLVVLQFEALGPVSLHLTLERLACCAGGSLLAVLAALTLWPVWEEQRFRPHLARTLETQAAYMEPLLNTLQTGGGDVPRELLRAKLANEVALAQLFACIRRLGQDPGGHRDALGPAAALAQTSLRLTHILNSMMVRLERREAFPAEAGMAPCGSCAGQILRALATTLRGTPPEGDTCLGLCAPQRALLEKHPDAWVATRLEHAAFELDVLKVGIQKLLGNNLEEEPRGQAHPGGGSSCR
nr:FUSC family protein [uncultured Holophaga sp.]